MSLVEFLVTVAVLAIVLTAGVPALRDFFERNRLVGAAEALYTEARLARADALHRAGNVVLTLVPGGAWCAGHGPERPGPGGVLEPSPCDCRLTDPLHPDACAIDADGDRLLRLVSASPFGSVRMGGEIPALIRFSGVRGTATPAAEIALTSASGLTLRVDISRNGNVRLCSPGAPFRGYPTC